MTTPPLPPPAHEGPLPQARAGSGGTTVLAGVPYAALPGSRPLELDLFLPPDTGEPVPLVVFLHGGGWRLGSRHSAGPAYAASSPFEHVAQAGVAVASIDYRLSGEAVWPAQLHDAKAAVRWLRSRSGELGIDPARIAAWGESAGGHLAELLGLTAETATATAALEGDVGVTGPSSAVSAVVSWYGPSDVAAVATDTGTDPLEPATREALLLGAPPQTVPELASQASPISHVTADAPPFLLLHGSADRLVPCVQSRRMHDALQAVGVDAELGVFEGADHMWRGSPEAPRLALARTADYLRRHLAIATEDEG
jgi:acetyl esterase/lipase